MQKYIAVFEVPATVRVEILVDEENQQAGLIAAHDLLQQIDISNAVVLSVNTDRAVNTSFERQVDSPSSLLGPLDQKGRYTVNLFDSIESTALPTSTHNVSSFATAKDLAESVLADTGKFAFAAVEDELGVTVLRVRAPRGAWEVLLMGEGVEPLETHSWIADRKSAITTAIALLGRSAGRTVRIMDYTDRNAGPRLDREIQ